MSCGESRKLARAFIEPNGGSPFYQLVSFKSNPIFHPCGESPNQKKGIRKAGNEELGTGGGRKLTQASRDTVARVTTGCVTSPRRLVAAIEDRSITCHFGG